MGVQASSALRPLRWGLAAFAFAALASAGASAAPTPGVGAHAPALEAADLDGTPRRVAWGEGAPEATVIFFFDPQSPDCLVEMSLVDALFVRARDLGLAVFAVEARGRHATEINRSLERYCMVYRSPSFPVLADPSFHAGRSFGVETVPVTFVMESHGVILNRIEGYNSGAAVVIARRVEQLLGRERGFFGPTLREAGIGEDEQRVAEPPAAAAAAAPARGPGVGDRAPDVEFFDRVGLARRWSWSPAADRGPRVIAFVGGLGVSSVEELSWLDSLVRRGADAGLEAVAVEVGGLSAAELEAGLERYRRYRPDPAFAVVADSGGKLAKAFGPWEQLPQTYLVASDGKILAQTEGFDAVAAAAFSDKTERAYQMLGRSFAPVQSVGATAAPPAIDEEAPSVRQRREREASYRGSLNSADAAFGAGDLDLALMHYLAVLALQAADLHALERIAKIHERRGDSARALEFWKRVLAVQPDHAEAKVRELELREYP